MPALNIRAQTFDMARTFYETARRARRRGRDLRARPLRADVHLPAADGLRDDGARRGDRGGLVGPGVHPGRPLPVQREEVRHRPRGDDRGDPAGVPARARRRLPQHRHRQLHAGRPLEARPRRAAARELRARGRAHGAHPGARDGRRDHQRRRRDRRGRQGELDRRRAARVPRRLHGGAREGGARRDGPLEGVGPDRHQPRRRAAARRRRGGGQARLQRPARAGRGRPLYGLAGAVQHGASTLPDELFHHFPAVETAEIHLATGFQNALYDHPAFPAALKDEIHEWLRTNAADERKDGQTEEQFLYTTRKKAIGPYKRSCGTCRRRTRSSPRRREARVPVQRAARQRHPGARPALHPAGPVSRPIRSRCARRSRADDRGRRDRRAAGVSVRLETPGDIAAVRAVELAAFTGPEEAESSTASGARRPRAGCRSSPWRRGHGGGHLLMSPCPVEDDAGANGRDGDRDRAGRRASRGPAAGDRQRPDARGHRRRPRSRRAGPRPAGPPRLLPAVRFEPARGVGLEPPADAWPDPVWLARRLPAWDESMRGTVRYPEAFGPLA